MLFFPVFKGYAKSIMWIGRLSRLLGPVSQCAFVFFFLRDVGSLGSKRHEINALVVTSCSHRKERRNCSDNKARDAEAPLCVLPSHVLSVPCKQTLCLPLIYIHTQLRAHTHTCQRLLTRPFSEGKTWQTAESRGPRCDWLGEYTSLKAATPLTQGQINHHGEEKREAGGKR